MTAVPLGRPVRVALIGCGLQGTNHSQILKGLGSELVEVAALCDSSLQRLSEASSTWPGASTAEDYRQALDSGDFDLVIVATMPNTHAEIAVAAMERGASVLCEKPFTLSVQEAEAVLEAASRTGRQVQLGTNMRYMPESRYLRDTVASGDVGSVVACKTWGCHFSPPVWGPHYRRRLAGGGVLASTLVHALDLSMWVGGNPDPVAVSAFSGRQFPAKRGAQAGEDIKLYYDTEDLLFALVRFDTGAVYTLEGNWCDERKDSHGFELITERATLRNTPLQVLVDELGTIVDRTPSGEEFENRNDWLGSVRKQDEEIVSGLSQGKPWTMQDANQLLTLQKVIDGCYESARLGHEVPI